MTIQCGRTAATRLLVAATTALLATSLAACSGSKARGQGALNTLAPTPPASANGGTAAPPPTTPPATTPAPASGGTHTTPPATTTPSSGGGTGSGKPAGKGYDKARSQWQQGATAISAEMGKYWLTAAAALTAGEVTDTGDTSGYLAAVKALTELASLPDAQQTPAQNAAFHADIAALNTFFNTPGLYS